MGARNFPRAVTRPATLALTVAVAVAVATAACGGHGGSSGPLSARAAGGLPSDLNVAFVEAGPGMGWVAGSHGGDPTVRLWAVAPGGAATAVTALPDLVSMGSAAVGPDLAVAGLRCHDGTAAARSCGSTTAEVDLVGKDGATTRVPLFTDPHTLDDGDGLNVVGGSPASVWIDTDRGLYEVSAAGKVLHHVDSPAHGSGCAFGGQLFAIVNPDAPPPPPPGGPPVTATVIAGQPLPDRKVELRQLTPAGTFTPIPGSVHTFPALDQPRCTDAGLEVSTPGGALVARWTPAAGWSDVAGVAPAPGTVVDGIAGTFAVGSGGAVLQRNGAGKFAATGVRLPDLRRAGSPPPTLVADQSATATVACTSRPAGSRAVTTACQVAAR